MLFAHTMPFKRILVAIDGSAGAQKALAKAVELAQLARAELSALAVEGRLPAYAATVGEVDEVKREKDVFFEQLADNARAFGASQGVDLEVDVRPGHAAELIVGYAKSHDFDLVVVGHKGHFLEDYLLGSTADRVAHHAHCPVMIVK
jgi:nucleotide-binding universal stress UspA family protein